MNNFIEYSTESDKYLSVLRHSDKLVSDKYNVIQQKLLERIAQNIAEHETKSVNSRSYTEIYNDLSKTIEYISEAHKEQKRKSGEPFIFHPLNVALIAAENGMIDKISINSCMLHDVIEDGKANKAEISDIFGEKVAETVDGLTKIKNHAVASYDKFFSHTIKHPRIAYIKIFDRLHNLRTLNFLDKGKQIRIALESMEIYHKLCIRLCLTDTANEIENLCAKVLYPDKLLLFEKRIKQFQARVKLPLDNFKIYILDKCYEHDIKIMKIRVQWRPFIEMDDYESMEISQVLICKIVVDTVENVYKLLWLINSKYKVTGSIADNISLSKFNNFKDISYPILIEGIKAPLLLTTNDFNEFNRKGILVYGFSEDSEINKKLMAHLQEYLQSEENFMDIENLSSFISEDDIQVFTKDGKTIVELKKGSTVLDFAFKIHSDLGLRASYGVVDGVKVGLDSELHNGNIVYIYTTDTITADEDFLSQCITKKAHKILKKHFESLQSESLFNIAKSYLEKKLFRYHINANELWERLNNIYTLKKELMEAVIATLTTASVVESLIKEAGLLSEEQIMKLSKEEESFLKLRNIFSANRKSISIEFDFLDKNYMTCSLCVPNLNNEPHKAIFSHRRFVIHRSKCDEINKVSQERLFTVRLRGKRPIENMIYMKVKTEDVSGVAHSISSVFKNVNLEMFNVENDHKKAFFRFSYHQKSPRMVSSYLEQLKKIREVKSINISTNKNIAM